MDPQRYGSMRLSPPASRYAVIEAFAIHGLVPPQDYVEFLIATNGADGALTPSIYLSLWRLEDIFSSNELYAVEEFAPGLLLFGSDGGGTAFAFDLTDEWIVVEIPFVPLFREEMSKIASTFSGFLDALRSKDRGRAAD